jgi:hypothetical protein
MLSPMFARSVLAAVVIASVTSACATGQEPTPTPKTTGMQPTGSPTPLSTTYPTATPPPTPPPVGRLAVDGIAELVTDNLVVRSLPEISAVSEIHPIRLSAPQLLFVLEGPVAADGYDWYRVAPFEAFPDDIAEELPRLGWVAAGDEGEAWIAPWSGECPEPSTRILRHMAYFLELACYGDEELTLEGVLGECTYIVPGTVSPDWLSSTFCNLWDEGYVGGVDGYELVGPFMFHLEPADFEVRTGPLQPVRVTGRYDHPAAQTCEHHPLEGDEPLIPELVVIGCRAAFVVTKSEGL